MSKNQLLKSGTSEAEEIYFLKENKKLIDNMHEKEKQSPADMQNTVVPIFQERRASMKNKKAA
jgi:hypothetical protein